ncbi:type II toxin-antitoxin system RelE/ParE family toxin [Prosthecobacter sp.]|uniref:type II toxin-antitoxin system RelE/ParE family toxin n=1 Tax=Prosthecobacter sp. TaxID=1965333 RepID=UPI00378469A7
MHYQIHPEVEMIDLEEIATYIARSNPRAADEVVGVITGMYDVLASQPQMGTEYHPLRWTLEGIRMITVTEYPNYLIYYRPLPENAGVRILYVLHGARDAAAFAKEHQRQ